jgi:crossover junction endodeoxyribonuclease RuvC
VKTIIGIDPGLASTGYGIIACTGSEYRHIAHGCITTGAGEQIEHRLLKIHEELSRIIDTYNPHEAGIETIYFAKNIKTAIPVAESRGVVLFLLASKKVEVFEYTPLEIKKAVAGRGRAEKDQVQNMIRIIFNMKTIPKPDHAADALAVAFCHSSNAYFQKAVKSVECPPVKKWPAKKRGWNV